MARLAVPRSLYSAPIFDQISYLAKLPGGVRISQQQREQGGRILWVVEAGERGSWGEVLAKALHGLLSELAADERVAG